MLDSSYTYIYLYEHISKREILYVHLHKFLSTHCCCCCCGSCIENNLFPCLAFMAIYFVLSSGGQQLMCVTPSRTPKQPICLDLNCLYVRFFFFFFSFFYFYFRVGGCKCRDSFNWYQKYSNTLANSHAVLNRWTAVCARVWVCVGSCHAPFWVYWTLLFLGCSTSCARRPTKHKWSETFVPRITIGGPGPHLLPPSLASAPAIFPSHVSQL